jgi:hypothetical protein
MKQKHPECFGVLAFYRDLIYLVNKDKHSHRKVARLLNRIRRQMKPYGHIARQTQFETAQNDTRQALKDTRLTNQVKQALMRGMQYEFRFKFPELVITQ